MTSYHHPHHAGGSGTPVTATVQDVLARAMSPDGAVQKEAERTIRVEIDRNPGVMIGAFMHLLGMPTTPTEIRGFCCVLLRRNLPIGEPMVLNRLSESLQGELKSELLRLLASETAPHIRNLLCDTIAELAQITLYRNEWPQLLPALEQMTLQPLDTLREAALNVIGKLGDALPDVQNENLGSLVALFARGLGDPSLAVRNAALNAVSSTFSHVDETQIKKFTGLRVAVLTVVRDNLVARGDSASVAVSSLVAMATRSSAFFRDDLQAVVHLISQVTGDLENFEEDVKQLSLELGVTIIEGIPNAARRCAPLLEVVLSLALSLMVAFDEEEDTWQHPAKAWEASEDAGFGAGESAFDRVARSVGGKKVTPVVFNLVSAALNAQASWKSRFSGLMALTQACEVISPQKLPDMVSLVLRCFTDESAFVQFSAINCIGQMCTDFGPKIQTDFHLHILPALLSCMDESRHPRVQAHAAAAVINFAEHCSSEILQQHADALVSKLYNLLRRPQRIIQEQAMTAIASVAECISVSFAKFYEHFVPLLKYAIANAHGPDNAMFRGRALECITFIGMAVGNDRFAPDAREVMEATVKIVQAGGFASDDPSYSYMVQAWTRICTALGSSFAPYLSVTVPTVLRSAQLQCVLGRIDDDEDETDDKQIFEIGNEQYGISTNQLEEKSLGCSALGSFVATMKQEFYPYLKPCVETLVPLLKFDFEENIRQAASTALPDLLYCAIAAHKAGMCDMGPAQELAALTVKSLLEGLAREEDILVLAGFVHAIQLCFDKAAELAATLFPMDVVKAVRDRLIKLIEQSEGRARAAAARRANHGDAYSDDEDEEERRASEKEADEQLQYMLAECFGSMIKALGAHFLPVFNESLPVLVQMLEPQSGPVPRKMAIFIFDDFVEKMAAQAGPYLPTLFPMVARYVSDRDSDIRQAVAYGIALCAQLAGDGFKPFCAAATQSLIALIQDPQARQAANRRATDNAVAALGKILRYQGDQVDAAQLLPAWLSMLPLRDDVLESAVCTSLLCDFVEGNDTRLLGADFGNLPKIVHVLLDVVHTKLTNPELDARIVPIIKQLPPGLMAQIVVGLPDKLQSKAAAI
ncbi:TOG domain-containing protein [Plasmodiophora brassicae]|uniref:TOG domain-containing protein n=1 Tax=Plasmodiophora brassicae TaxID=37360 RepID=A0A3P3YBD3_PLABS|nr:unnamed protein product [Plasmodiophora brassicae]